MFSIASILAWILSPVCRSPSQKLTDSDDDNDDDDGDDVVGKNLKVSPSFSYQVQHAAARPQAARACPRCLLKNTCLFAFHFGEKIIAFFIFGHCKSKQVVPSALRHTLSAQSTALRSVFTLMGADRATYLFQIFSHGKQGEYKGFVVAWGNRRVGVHEPPYSPSFENEIYSTS